MRPYVLLAVALLLPGCVQVELGAPPDQTGTSTATTAASVPVPRVAFTLDPASPRVDQAVIIDLQVTGLGRGDSVVGSWWRFGDGTTSNQREPIHVFKAAGPHTVEVTVTTALGATARAERVVDVRAGGQAGAPAAGPAAVAALAKPTIVAHVERNLARFAFEAPYTPDSVAWSFGDGATSTEATPEHTYLSRGSFAVAVRLTVGGAVGSNATQVTIFEVPFIPHVVVGVADSGFNVYHQVYRRPELVEHPCTYVRDYPCDIPALHLTLDATSWEAAFNADKAKWAAIQPGDRYWIPGTNIIGAVCMEPYEGSNAASTNPLGGVDYCILDDTEMHGTGTSSSVLSENPDALLVVVEGNSGGAAYLTDGVFPIDVISHSWGSAAPLPALCSGPCEHPLFVLASGNEGAFPAVLDGDGASTNAFIVGAADAGSRSEPGYSGWKTMDFVSEYCRPTAQTRSLTEMREQYCGTSFSAPTFAGALSRVILELRKGSGYDGGLRGTMVDPIAGMSAGTLREALNRTATYAPEDQWGDGGDTVPLVAPWYQWGWGYYDRTQVDETLACLRLGACPTRPAETVAYMEALWAYRSVDG